jgi:hypothetical protein
VRRPAVFLRGADGQSNRRDVIHAIIAFAAAAAKAGPHRVDASETGCRMR